MVVAGPDISNGAVGSRFQESSPCRYLPTCILQRRHRNRHKAECAHPGDEPNHADRTVENWKRIRPMDRRDPKSGRRHAERQTDSPWTSGETWRTVLGVLASEEPATGCQTSPGTTLDFPVAEPTRRSHRRRHPIWTNRNRPQIAHAEYTHPGAVTPVGWSGQFSKCQEAAPLGSGSDARQWC